MSRHPFDAWADEHGISPGARILILHEAVALVAQERDDLLALLSRRGVTGEEISAELDRIEAARGEVE